MALPILDGNQSATTLSTILSGGEHTPAHTVVSLGSTAISNITSAVSGSVVSVSNLPSTQTIAGTVTANIFGKNLNSPNVFQIPVIYSDEYIPSGGVVIPVHLTTDQGSVYSGNPLPISGTVTANIIGYNYQEGGTAQIPIKWDNNENNYIPIGPSVDPIPLPISGTVTVGNSVTISSLPSISGTVTIGGFSTVSVGSAGGILVSGLRGGLASPVNLDSGSGRIEGKAVAQYSSGGGFVDVSTSNPLPVSQQGAISGTVTVGAVPNGSLTTRFGTPTTANTAFATSAVTNASRKYLLVQNVTTGGNVITVGIGFTPTTTQGIQLAVGAGITFESSYIPTGAVYVLSSVTASNFTILEA